MEAEPNLKKAILFLIMLVCFCSFALATTNTNNLIYYSGDNNDVSGTTLIDISNNSAQVNATLTGANASNFGRVGQSIGFDGDADFFKTNTLPAGSYRTFRFWLFPNQSIVGDGAYNPSFLVDPGDNLPFIAGGSVTGGMAGESLTIGGVNTQETAMTATIPGNVWTHIVITWNDSSSKYEFFMNGTKQTTINDGAESALMGSGNFGTVLEVGYRDAVADKDYNGRLDEYGIWNYSWTTADIVADYNAGAGDNPYATTSENFTLTANSSKTGNPILTFNASIDGSLFSTTTGTITTNILKNDTKRYNITLFDSNLLYQNRTFNLVNVSNDLSALLVPFFKMNATNFYNGTTIFNFNATINGNFFSTTNGVLTTNITFNESAKNITVESTDYDDRNYSNYNVSNDLSAELFYFFNFSSLTYSEPVLELAEQTITLNVNVSESQVTSATATLNYNGSFKTVTATDNGGFFTFSSTFNTPAITGNQNASFTWNVSIVRSSGTTFTTFTQNQTITNLGIDNCSTFTTRAINFSLYNESTNALIGGTGTMDGFFRVWVEDMNDFISFNLTWAGDNQYGLCIDPASAEITLYGQIEYTAPDFPVETYYFEQATVNNITESINLYLTDGTALITFNVVDENDDPVVNALIHVLTYDIPTDSFVTTEILKTGFGGTAIGNLIQNTQDYKFMIVLNNETFLETAEFKILLTEYTFVINLGSDYFENYNIIREISGDVTYTNATTTFSYSFVNPTGLPVEGCLEITHRSINSDTIINETCVTSASGTIDIILPSSPMGTYIGVGSVNFENQFYVLDSEVADFDTLYKTFGLEGLFVTFLMMIVLVMAGVWHPAAAISLLLVGTVLSIALDIFKLSWFALATLIILGGITIYRLRKT